MLMHTAIQNRSLIELELTEKINCAVFFLGANDDVDVGLNVPRCQADGRAAIMMWDVTSLRVGLTC